MSQGLETLTLLGLSSNARLLHGIAFVRCCCCNFRIVMYVCVSVQCRRIMIEFVFCSQFFLCLQLNSVMTKNSLGLPKV